MSNLGDPIPEGSHCIHGQGVSGYGIPIHDGAGEVEQCIVLCSTNDRLDEDTIAVHSEVVAPIYDHESIHNLVQ